MVPPSVHNYLGGRGQIPFAKIPARDGQRRGRATPGYVALTRAKDELYLTYPLLITDYNRQSVLQKPSRFITCPAALYEIWNLEEENTAFAPAAIELPSSDKYLN